LALDSVRTNFYENEHDLFYFGVFNPKDAKISFSTLAQKKGKKFRQILVYRWTGQEELGFLASSSTDHTTTRPTNHPIDLSIDLSS
jgi:hypothetical protein